MIAVTSANVWSAEWFRSVASPDTSNSKHFYQAANGTELDQAFQDIVRNIDKLTVTR